MTIQVLVRLPFAFFFALGPYRVYSVNMLSENEVCSPPWPSDRSLRLGECDMTDFYCSL
jgi:hypothetical protein